MYKNIVCAINALNAQRYNYSNALALQSVAAFVLFYVRNAAQRKTLLQMCAQSKHAKHLNAQRAIAFFSLQQNMHTSIKCATCSTTQAALLKMYKKFVY